MASLSLILPLAGAALGFTQDDIFRFMEDERDVTTVSEMATKIEEVPQPVYIITGEEVRRLAPQTVAELLAHLPGAIVVSPTAGQWTLVVHTEPLSMVNNYVMIMIDGRQVVLPAGNLPVWWPLPIAPEDIDRIEFVMGPASTIHGAQAIDGVVNFITKKATQAGATATVAGGSSWAETVRGGDGRIHVSGTLPQGPWQLRLAAGIDRRTPMTDDPLPIAGRSARRPAAQRMYANGRIERRFGEDVTWTTLLGGSLSEGPYISLGPSFATFRLAQLDTQLELKALANDEDRLDVRTYVNVWDSDIEFNVNPLLPAIPMEPQDTHAAFRAVYTTPLLWSQRLVTGLDGMWTLTRWPFSPGGSALFQNYAAFVQDELRVTESLILTAGIRLDKHITPELAFGDRWNLLPRASVVWLPTPGHALRLSYGRGIYYPSVLEDYSEVTLYDGRLSALTGSGALTPRDSHVVELGYRGQLYADLVVTASYNFRIVSSMIWLAPEGEAALPVHVTNFAGTEYRHAIDMTASWRPSPRVRADVVCTLNVLTKHAEAIAERAGTVPKWRLSGRLHLTPFEGGGANLTATSVAPHVARGMLTGTARDLQGWVYVDLLLTYQLTAAFELFFTGTNLFDWTFGPGEARELPDPGVGGVGRRLLLGLRLSA